MEEALIILMPFFNLAIIVAIITVVIHVLHIVAKHFENIAFDKGYDRNAHSYVMCLLLGIIGYLYVIALPDKRLLHRQERIITLLENSNKSN